MQKRIIKYGGALTGLEEERAIIKSIRKSRKTRNWQQGEEGKLLEEECAKYLGVKHAVLTTSGSCAGLLALSALELPKGSEVIIGAVTFPTIFNIILQCGLTPVVVDCKVGTYGFDVTEVEKAITSKTRAIIAIHPVGNPVDMPALMKMVGKVNTMRAQGRAKYEHKYDNQKIYVIEDNCDGWGSTIQKRKVGSFGDISFTSFHAAHIVSMGCGGGVFTNDKTLAERVRMYRDWGRQANIDRSENLKHKGLPRDYNPRFIYEKVGYNFQILELQAAMGRVQLRKTAKIKATRKKNFDYLVKHLSKYEDLVMPVSVRGADVCWFAFPLTVVGNRGKLLKHLEKHGIETRPMFSGNITRHPAYDSAHYRISGSLVRSDFITAQSFWVSCHPALSKSDLEYMVEVFDDFFKKHA